MILFVFEGEKQEPKIYETIEKLFFKNRSNERICAAFCGNIFAFYEKITKLFSNKEEIDIFILLKKN